MNDKKRSEQMIDASKYARKVLHHAAGDLREVGLPLMADQGEDAFSMLLAAEHANRATVLDSERDEAQL